MHKKIFLLAFLILILPWQTFAQPVCPICTIAVAGGVGLCRYLGIDDLISGTWVGGLIVSFILWTIDWLNRKEIHFLFRKIIISFFFYLIVILPLYWLGIMGHLLNKFWGIDRLLFGIISGSIAFLIGFWLDNFLRKKNQGKVFFLFQKVVLPILALIITSLIFSFVC